jgi:hypothetical protein
VTAIELRSIDKSMGRWPASGDYGRLELHHCGLQVSTAASGQKRRIRRLPMEMQLYLPWNASLAGRELALTRIGIHALQG